MCEQTEVIAHLGTMVEEENKADLIVAAIQR